jgi:hypothetical protein
MKRPTPSRAVVVLIVLAVLLTVALALQERRSVPRPSDSPVPPVGRGARAWVERIAPRLTTQAFWSRPWPWVVVGLVGFGLLAGGLLWRFQRTERD